MKVVRIGTRSSPLALWQARKVASLLEHHDYTCEIVEISSSGDRSVGGDLATSVGQFIHGIDEQLLTSHIDIAVHSAKDVPTGEFDGIAHLAYLERGCTNDLLLLQPKDGVQTLAQVLNSTQSMPIAEVVSHIDHGRTVGTVSGRRQSFLLSLRPDIIPLAVRGQVGTRLLRLHQGRVDAVVLAEIGLRRLHEIKALEPWMLELSCFRIDENEWPTAPGQGAISVHCSTERKEALNEIRGILNHVPTELEVDAERQALHELGGGCLFPAGIRAQAGQLNVKVSPQNWRDIYSRGHAFRTLKYQGDLTNYTPLKPESTPIVRTNPIDEGRRLVSTLNSERLGLRLIAEGINVLNKPVLSLEPLAENWPALDLDGIADRKKWPLLLLTSPFAARCAAVVSEHLPAYRRIQWAAIGEGTARACFKLGVTASLCGMARNSKDFASYLETMIDKNTPLLLPQSNRADGSFAASLAKSEFTVQKWIGYENKTKSVEVFSGTEGDVLLLSSPSSAVAWVDNALPIANTILCMGESTKSQLAQMEEFSNAEIQVLKGPTADYIAQWWQKKGGD